MTATHQLCAIFLFATLLIWLGNSANTVEGRSFVIDYKGNQFLKDGQPYQYISGSIHYFRVPRVYWQDRLYKMWAAGLNTIETYVEWSLHEPEPQQYNFEDNLDLLEFLTLANKTGFTVVLRPGPYIDSELDFGGFPYWLLRENPYMVLRTNDPTYLNFVDNWMGHLLPMVRPFLYENGGPIISVQVENEYGSYYTCNYKYKIHLRNLFRKYLGDNVVLFTTDGSGSKYLDCGTIDGVYPTVDFGVGSESSIDSAFNVQREFAPSGPLINSEFYTGWLDHWGEPHARVNVFAARKALDYILSKNASVNMYMFHGGTSFGFTAGANMGLLYQACPTSYDYAAPLTEAGDPTDLLLAIRQVISKYRTIPPGPVPPATKKYAYGYVTLELLGGLFDLLPSLLPSVPVKTFDPATFEELGQAYGFVLYETTLPPYFTGATISISGIRDRAYIFLNKDLIGILSRTDKTTTITTHKYGNDVLSILVENQGRICVGSDMTDFKGILYNVTCNGAILHNWKMSLIPLNNTENLNRSSKVDFNHVTSNMQTPSFYYGELKLPKELQEAEDTFLDTTGWTKGVAFVNGFNLGRYWPVKGPQVTLFVPKSVLLPYPQINKIILFEQDGAPPTNPIQIQFIDYPIIDSLVDSNSPVKAQPACKVKLV